MLFKKIMFFIMIIIGLISCKEDLAFEPINFNNNYKFNSEIEKNLLEDTVAWKNQIAAGAYAIKGNYRNALAQWDIAFPSSSSTVTQNQIDSISAKYKVFPAIDYIVEKAKSEKIIMVNEAHNNILHRVFTEKLLVDLYNSGYKNLGLEALTNGEQKDSALNERGYPILKTGYYTKNPQFANLIRTALKIGYNVFPYEQTSNVNGKEREIEQARNIKKIMDQRPNEKFLIHCGFDHILEGNHKKWGKTLAGRLKEFTGIDPLTINQTKYSERSEKNLNDPLLKALNLSESSILLNNKNEPLNFKRKESYADIAVIHPVTEYLYSRPKWLFSDKRSTKINLKKVDISFPAMILAYQKGEDFNKSVPSDIVEIQTKNNFAYLALNKGHYNIIVTNKSNKSLKAEIEVE